MSRFVDCQMCGAIIVEHLWKEHELEHHSGRRRILSVEEVTRINAIARQSAHYLWEDEPELDVRQEARRQQDFDAAIDRLHARYDAGRSQTSEPNAGGLGAKPPRSPKPEA